MMLNEDHFRDHVRHVGADARTPILCLPAFGDDSGVYEPLSETSSPQHFRLVLTELPGFGGSAPLAQLTTLQTLADYVDRLARREHVEIVMAHSVASITASLATRHPESPIKTIVSLEGNLTPADAYHSGTAADFCDAEVFKATFLERLAGLDDNDTGIPRFRRAVVRADPWALWQLGCDARAFSDSHDPGEVLCASARVIYLYDPKNMPPETLAWIEEHDVEAWRLDGVSHWMTSEQPEISAAAIVRALEAHDSS